MEKRIRATEGPNFKPPSVAKCTYNLTTSTKCGEVCIPMAKFCVKHILEDDKQVGIKSINLVNAPDFSLPKWKIGKKLQHNILATLSYLFPSYLCFFRFSTVTTPVSSFLVHV